MPRSPDSSPQTRAVLVALLYDPLAWCHGYDLAQRTNLKSGTLYPILMRLADRGLLEHRWQEPERPGRPPRHAYRLTAEGEALARQRVGPVSAVPAPSLTSRGSA